MHHLVPTRDRRGAVAIIFATAIIALVMVVGLAVDYGYYVQAQSQLDLAADAGAIHAVRVAATQFESGQNAAAATAAGSDAGQQWFLAQLGNLQTGSLGSGTMPNNVPPPVVIFDPATSSFTANVTYAGTVPTHFGATFGIRSWPVSGAAQTVVSTLNYSEIVMLIDNSSSMLIGATPTDISALQNATICAPTATAVAAQQAIGAYSWQFPAGKGWGFGNAAGKGSGPGNGGGGNGGGNDGGNGNGGMKPPKRSDPQNAATRGQCSGLYTGDAANCPYPADLPVVDDNGYCPAGTGIPDTDKNNIDPITRQVANIPQAPCGFACHTGNGRDDYYNAARKLGSAVQLRFDVVQNAAATVVQTMQSQMQVVNQFTLGVFEFNAGVTQVHPAAGGTFLEADSNLASALSDIKAIQPPIVSDQPNTYFSTAVDYLAANLQPSGDGTNANARRKDIFIVTDGLEDDQISGRTIGPVTSQSAEAAGRNCAKLKALGFNVFVLYTPYYPLPNNFYLAGNAPQTPKAFVEPLATPTTTNPVVDGLQACASNPSQFYQAANPADIQAAMLAMLKSATSSPARISM